MNLKRATAVGAAVGAWLLAYRSMIKPWHERWGATDEEVSAGLPGDDLLEEPASQITRAITIHAPREEVWPWIVQLGADRGGFYTYDRLENLFGLDIHSADRIVEQWQDLAVGDVVYADRARTGGWYVVDLRPDEALVLKIADLASGRPLRRDEKFRWEFLWIFALQDSPAGGTRLLVRERVAFGSALTGMLMSPVNLVSFVMSRGMLMGIKSRVESHSTRPLPRTG